MTGERHKIGSGQNGQYMYCGFIAFVTTGATVELDVPFKRIHGYSLCAVGTPASDEILSINETVDTDSHGNKTIATDASGNVTVTRTGASKTSALKVAFIIWGK